MLMNAAEQHSNFKLPMKGALVAGLSTVIAILFVTRLKATQYNNYVLLAVAFLHGHAWINWPGAYIDALLFEGRRYVIEAPMPAILLMPFVAIFGTSMNQTLFSAALAGVAVGAGWELARRFHVSFETRLWLCGFLLLGTDLFWCAACGGVWFTAHVSAVAFTLLALLELKGKRRAWLVALYACCAAESRFTLALALPVYAALSATDPLVALRLRKFLAFCSILAVFGLMWVLYNEARWHLPFDAGYTLWYRQDAAGSASGSPFQPQYLPEQLYSFFVRFPDLLETYPYFRPSISGIALTWTSPALLLAFFARKPGRWVLAARTAAILTLVPNLLYYVNGFMQFGMRHALDFEPFLFLLMLLAVRPRMPWYGKLLCGYSMLVGVWGMWYWVTYYNLI
jgi:hypothetical protein